MMTNAHMVKAFNQWMRRFIEEPARFYAEFQTVTQFLKDQQEGRGPTYGETCTAYMAQLASEMPAN
jgi:beta-glucanase (GH16 family)